MINNYTEQIADAFVTIQEFPDEDERQANTAFSSETEERKIKAEEKTKQQKEDEIETLSENVISNPLTSQF